MVYHCTDVAFQDATNEEEEEEDFPTAPLDDDVSLGKPVTNRHFCIHEQSWPHDQCPYPCPYILDQLYFAPENAPTPRYKMMEPSDIFGFHDVMTTTCDEDIPDLDDVLDFE